MIVEDELFDEAQNDELNAVAMQIILYAGNAKTLADKAFQLAKELRFDEAYEKINEAESNELLKAHQAQFKIIQEEASGKGHRNSLLFTHAQDHLMTIKLEVNMIRKMIELCEFMLKDVNN